MSKSFVTSTSHSSHSGPALRARQLSSNTTDSHGRWMYAPGGVHTITPGAGAGSAEVTLRIDESTAAVLNASLTKLNSEHAPHRAFFDKEHDELAGATAWPKRFVWNDSPQPGVYVEIEASAFGKELVDGKVMRAFSPSFLSDAALPKRVGRGQHVTVPAGQRGSPENPARMTGLCFPACGTLTNNPAFRKILPLWARNQNNTQTNGENMITEEQGALLAQDQTDSAQNPERESSPETETLRARNAELEATLLAQRTKDADEAVKAAVKRGVIPVRDEALQAKWKKRCIEDPDNLELLASIKGSPALENPRQRLTLSGVQITREDSLTVLKAYNTERDPRRKGAIYARELSKRIKDGEDLPIHASNTLGTLSGEIVTQNALELLVLEQPMMKALSTDFSAEAVKKGQEINTRIVSIPSTSAYNDTTGYAVENTVTTDVAVTIDTHKSCQVSFNANELASTSRRLFDEFAPAMAYAIGKDFIDAVLAIITTANFTETPTTEALSDFDREVVIEMAGALSDRGVPNMGRSLLLTGSYYDKLFSDGAIVTLASTQRADLITGNQLIPVHGFNVMRCASLPSTGNLTGFGFSKSALVVAGRVPNDYANALPGATGGGTIQVITEPNSGISVQLVQFVDHKLGAAYARMAYMYGAAKGQPKAGQILRSQAP